MNAKDYLTGLVWLAVKLTSGEWLLAVVAVVVAVVCMASCGRALARVAVEVERQDACRDR